jgi:hypothetical protein
MPVFALGNAVFLYLAMSAVMALSAALFAIGKKEFNLIKIEIQAMSIKYVGIKLIGLLIPRWLDINQVRLAKE